MTSHLAFLHQVLEDLDPPPPWPGWTNRWVEQAHWLRAQITNLGSSRPADCLDWPGRQDTYGRGYLLGRRWSPYWLRFRGVYKLQCTHHKVAYVAWEFAFGAIPDHHMPVQTCGNGLCWNPAHLALRPSSRRTHKDRHYAE